MTGPRVTLADAELFIAYAVQSRLRGAAEYWRGYRDALIASGIECSCKRGRRTTSPGHARKP